MTIREIIAFVDDIKPNAFTQDVKLKLLNEAEYMIEQEIYLLPEDKKHEPYEAADLDNEPLAPEARQDIYSYYIIAQIDYFNEDYDKYQNAKELFNRSFINYQRSYAIVYEPANIAPAEREVFDSGE